MVRYACSRSSHRSPHVVRSKIIENLAVVDYDTNNMYLAAYDWRVSMYNLEVRDAYYTRLKSTIEMFKCVLQNLWTRAALTDVGRSPARR